MYIYIYIYNYKVHKLHQRYILIKNFLYIYIKHVCVMEFMYHVRVTIDDLGLCCTCVMSFEHWLTPLNVDSAWAFWASFCFIFICFNFHHISTYLYINFINVQHYTAWDCLTLSSQWWKCLQSQSSRIIRKLSWRSNSKWQVIFQ